MIRTTIYYPQQHTDWSVSKQKKEDDYKKENPNNAVYFRRNTAIGTGRKDVAVVKTILPIGD